MSKKFINVTSSKQAAEELKVGDNVMVTFEGKVIADQHGTPRGYVWIAPKGASRVDTSSKIATDILFYGNNVTLTAEVEVPERQFAPGFVYMHGSTIYVKLNDTGWRAHYANGNSQPLPEWDNTARSDLAGDLGTVIFDPKAGL